MDVLIIDPNLETNGGHHLFYCSAIATELRTRGANVQLIGNIRFPEQEVAGCPVLRHFRVNGYPPKSNDLIRGLYDQFKASNDILFSDLCELPQRLFPASALVIFPTVTEHQLYALMRWASLFPAASSPYIVVWLMLPSGVHVAIEPGMQPRVEIVEPLRALLYKLALDIGTSLRGRVQFFGSGNAHAREYSAIAGELIEPHPIIMNIDANLQHSATNDRRVLLYAGDAKLDKGLALVPGLARELRQRYPDWTVVIHANFSAAWGEALELKPKLETLALSDPSIRVHVGKLTRDAYAEMLASCSVSVITYDPIEYKRKSSGVVWEAIASGMPVVVPARTWLSEEVEEWRGAVVGYDSWTVPSILESLDRVLPNFESLRAIATRAAARFRERNNVVSAVDQLIDAWVGGAWLKCSVLLDEAIVISAPEFRGSGWHFVEIVDNIQVRWMDEYATIETELPDSIEWLIRLKGPSTIDSAILRSVVLTANGRRLRTDIVQNGDGPWVLTSRWRPERLPAATGRLSLALELRCTYSAIHPDDSRAITLVCSEIALLSARRAERGALPPKIVSTINLCSGELRALFENNQVVAYEVAGAVEGWASFPFVADAALEFKIHKEPDSIKPVISVEINGVSTPVQVSASASGTDVSTRVPAALFLDRDGLVDIRIDLTMLDGADVRHIITTPLLRLVA